MKNNNYITKKLFFWLIGILITLGITVAGYVVGKTDSLSETFNHNFTQVKEDISSIKTDISWLKTNLR